MWSWVNTTLGEHPNNEPALCWDVKSILGIVGWLLGTARTSLDSPHSSRGYSRRPGYLVTTTMVPADTQLPSHVTTAPESRSKEEPQLERPPSPGTPGRVSSPRSPPDAATLPRGVLDGECSCWVVIESIYLHRFTVHVYIYIFIYKT